MKQVMRIAIVFAISAAGGTFAQTAIPVNLSVGPAVDDYNYTSTFDKADQNMSRDEAFSFVRRAAHETARERFWAYVPGRLVLLGIETDASDSVEADMELLTGLMKNYRNLDLLHTHVRRDFSCADSRDPVSFSAGDYSCRSQLVEVLKNAVPSPYDLSNAILAAALYDSLQPGDWQLRNFVFTPVSEVQYGSTPIGIYRLRLRGDRALRTKMGMIGSYSREFPEEIVPGHAGGVLSVEEMRTYVQKLVHRYGQYKEFTMQVAK